MEKEEKEIETPSKGAKGGAKKRPGGSSTGAAVPAAAPPAPAPPRAVKAPPHPALVGSTNSTTAPALPTAAPVPPVAATHTGLPQQVNCWIHILELNYTPGIQYMSIITCIHSVFCSEIAILFDFFVFIYFVLSLGGDSALKFSCGSSCDAASSNHARCHPVSNTAGESEKGS